MQDHFHKAVYDKSCRIYLSILSDQTTPESPAHTTDLLETILSIVALHTPSNHTSIQESNPMRTCGRSAMCIRDSQTPLTSPNGDLTLRNQSKRRHQYQALTERSQKSSVKKGYGSWAQVHEIDCGTRKSSWTSRDDTGNSNEKN